MAITYLDNEPKISYIDEKEPRGPIAEAATKAEFIQRGKTPLETATSKTVNQAKNMINAGLFGQPERMFPEQFKGIKSLDLPDRIAGEVLGGGVIGGAIIGGALKGIKSAYSVPAIKENPVIEKATDLVYKLGGKAKVMTEIGLKFAKDKIALGLSSINKHKDILQYGDEVGRLPKTLEEAVSAASQTKKNILDQYKALSASLGDEALVDMKGVADAIRKEYSGIGKKIAAPGTQEYALKIADDYEKMGKISIDAAEDAIATFNKSLEPFYRSGGFANMADTSRAGVDAVASSSLRKQVDGLVEGATGKSYQDLKNAYGSVAELEKMFVKQVDKIRRTTSRPAVGVVDTVPILYGSFTGNVPLVAAGVVQKVGQKTLKRFTDPSAITERAFSLLNRSKEKTLLQRAIDARNKVGVAGGVVSGEK